MPYFDRIDVPKGIDVNKTSKSKKHDICHYCYFLIKRFRFQPYACNKCHNSLIIYMSLSDIVIFNFQIYDYHSVFSGIRKSEAMIFFAKYWVYQKKLTL